VQIRTLSCLGDKHLLSRLPGGFSSVMALQLLIRVVLLLSSAIALAHAELPPVPLVAAAVAAPRVPIKDSIYASPGSSVGTSKADDTEHVLEWLRVEKEKLFQLRADIKNNLASKQVFGDAPAAGHTAPTSRPQLQSLLRAVKSTSTNDINCRINLDRVPFGAKALSPCNCKGTNEVSADK
jgi:hypothetical protein